MKTKSLWDVARVQADRWCVNPAFKNKLHINSFSLVILALGEKENKLRI